jgi:hypothetical protein
MKRIQFALLIAISFVAFSCDNNAGPGGNNNTTASKWTDVHRDKFMESCTDGAKALGDKAKPYCQCTLEKLEKKYPNPIDAGRLTNSETESIAKDCY